MELMVMAGDWIPMQTSLWECPQVVRILSAKCPDVSDKVRARCEILGALYRTWSLFDAYSEDGVLDGYTQDDLDSAVGIPGWSELLQHVGWLGIEPQRLIMPEFEEWMSASAKRRMKDARRKQQARKSMSAFCPQRPDKMRTTEEKRREEKRKEPPSFPPPLATEEFRTAWADWESHRREIRKPLTGTCVRQQLERLAALGHERAVAMIRYTISQGWQGLREEEGDGRSGKARQATLPKIADLEAQEQARGRG